MEWRGFELHPETPLGGIRIVESFGMGTTDGMRAHLREFAARFGVEAFDLPDRMSNTRRALAAAEWARDRGKLTEFRHAAMGAYWRRGMDLESDQTIVEIAAEIGLDGSEMLAVSRSDTFLARVVAARNEASLNRVTGIPTMMFGDVRIVGCQPYETIENAARRAGAVRKMRRQSTD